MTTESYQNRKNTQAVGSNPKTDKMNTWKGSINQRDIVVFAITLLVIAVVSKTAGYSVVHTDSLAVGVGALEDHEVDGTDSVLAKGIFGMGDISDNNGFVGVGSYSCICCRNDYHKCIDKCIGRGNPPPPPPCQDKCDDIMISCNANCYSTNPLCLDGSKPESF